MNKKPYTALIPPHIGVVPINGFGPKDPARRQKLWRDNSQVSGQSLFAWSISPMVREYQIIARNVDGTPKLTPIESMAAYNTYSLSAMSFYREHHFAFPFGIPYLETVTVGPEDFEINLGGITPAIDYPVVVQSHQVLIWLNGELFVMDYQDAAKAFRPPVNGVASRLDLIGKTLNRSDMTPEGKLSAIRKLVTDYDAPVALA